jgi:phosphoglycolate phosphatase-like HAD superfamily hydrolase
MRTAGLQAGESGPPAIRHVVWDWNGTLFDDLHIVLEAVNAGISEFGVGPITLDDYRDHYTRPVRVFYDRLFGREIEELEWKTLDARFHDGYRELLAHARPHCDALAALEAVRSRGLPQSLLSMFPHTELVPLVDKLGLTPFFDRIDGLRGTPGDSKALYLEEHFRKLIAGERPETVLVIGDTPDDALAAGHVGARCVLYHNGAHHYEELEALGVPVVESLIEAVQI